MTTRVLPLMLLAAAGSVCAEDEIAPEISVEVVEVPAEARTPRVLVTTTTLVGFFANLTKQEKATAGLDRLSAEQCTALDAQVAKEVKLARQGDVPGFAGTFISRRTEAERTASGLGTLTTAEKYQLDRLVSRALAARPPQPPVLPGNSQSGVDLLKPKSPWETHGFAQLEYGCGRGDSEYKAATVAVEHRNTKTGTALLFAYTVADATGYLSRWQNYSMGWRSRPYGPWRY